VLGVSQTCKGTLSFKKTFMYSKIERAAISLLRNCMGRGFSSKLSAEGKVESNTDCNLHQCCESLSLGWKNVMRTTQELDYSNRTT
jgi:hypothetical protein